MSEEYHSDGDEWMTEIAKANLNSAGFTDQFEDVSYHDYQGEVMYVAFNPTTNIWGSISYSYGSCSGCGSTENCTEDDFREMLSDITEQEMKPKAGW